MARNMTARGLLSNNANSAAQLLADSGLDRWTRRKDELEQSTNDFNNYLNSGNYSLDNNKKYRGMATQAVADLDTEMKRYGTNSNEYKTLKGYKTYYENALPTFDRLDVTANARDYLSYDPKTYKYQSWHSEEDYNNQKAYLDDKRKALQAEMDELGETESDNYKALKSWMEQYDELAEALEDRNRYDRQFETPEDYAAYERSHDYNNNVQTLKQKDELQAQLAAAEETYNRLQPKFYGITDLGAITPEEQKEYEDMLNAQQTIAKLKPEVLKITGDLAGLEKYQGDEARDNFYREYGVNGNVQDYVDSLKEAREKAEDLHGKYSTEWAKIDLQIRALAGENEDGTNENKLYDESTPLGRYIMSNFDVAEAEEEIAKIDKQLQELGAPSDQVAGRLIDKFGFLGAVGAGMNHQQFGAGSTIARDVGEAKAREDDPRVMELRAQKAQWQQKINSSDRLKERNRIDNAYGGLKDKEALAEEGAGLILQDGKGALGHTTYQKPGAAAGENGDLGRYFSYLNDEALAGTDWEDMASNIRGKIYAAIAAENKGLDIGYTVDDVLKAYEGNMAAIAGYLDAKKINDTEGSLGRFLKQEGFLLGGAAWNNLTHVGDMFTDDIKPANRLENMQANVLQNMGEYGGVGGINVTDDRNLAQTIGEATWTTGNMLPSIAASYLMSGGLGALGAEAATAKTAGKLVGAGMMGLTSGGQAYQQALAEGWSKEDARLYGTIIGAAEVGTQYAIGGITRFGGITEDKLLAMCKGIDHVLPRVIAETSIHIGSEVAEELVQNRIERYLQYDLFREGNEDWMSWTDDDWYTVVVTALSTGAMEGPGTAYSLAMQNRTGKALSGAIIPGKGITPRQRANNTITKAVGEMMQGNEPLSFTLVNIGTNMTEVGSEANEMATKMEEGKLPKNAMNLGELYGLTMAEFQKQDGKNGIDKFMNAMQGGATTYNGIESAKSIRDASKAEYEKIKSENPDAVVLDQNATALRNLGINESDAVEYGAIMNKILSGEKLTDTEADKVSADTKAGQAIRAALSNEIGEFDRTAAPEITKATITAVYNEMKLEKQRQQESLRVSVVQAAMNAAKQAEVNRATASTDFAKAQWASESQAYGAGSVLDKAVSKQSATIAPKRVGYHEATQKAVDSKIAQEMQAADQKVRDAERQVQLLGKMSFEEAAKYHFTGLEGIMGDMKTMQDLQTRLGVLNEEAKKITAVHMPSAQQRTRLNDINAERNQIIGQQMALMSKHAANLREGAEKIATEQAAKAQAEAAQNSSAEDTIRLPGIGDKTRSQFVQEYLQRHEGATEAEANEMFEKRAAETGGYVKKGNVENGQNQQNASTDEGRNSLGNETDGGENRTGRPGQPTEVQRQRLESSSRLLSRDGEEAARVEKGSALTDGRSLDLLVDKYDGIEDFVQTLYDLGFDRVTLVTDGQMLDPKGDRIPALFYKGELFLSLDYGEPGKYDYKSYAKHEVGHLKLEQLRRFFGEKKAAWFVANAVQSLTESPEEYASLFKKYANMYRAYKMIDGISDEEFVNMVNEEILCDMLGGLHGLERFIDKADAYLEQTNFNTVARNIQKGERLPGQLQVVDALKESEMPYNTPVTTLMSTTSVDSPNTVVVPADQVSRMAYYGLMNALGFFVNKSKEDVKEGRQALKRGEHAAYWSKEDAEAKQNPVRIDMNNEEDREKMLRQVYNSPVGEMIRYAENNGFLSEDPEEAARIANAEYELFARIGAITDETRDFYMSMQFIGSALFTAMKMNADKQYNTTYDPNSVCTKTQAIIDDMSAQMVDLKRGLYQSEILEIYRSQFEAGNPVTCPECYVFTHWVGIGGLLEKIYKYQNKYAAMSPEEVVKEYKQLYNDVTDELNDKVKPLKEELANPNTTPERAAELQQLLKKNTFGKTRGRLIKEANEGLPKIREKIEKGQTLSETELKNQKKWERHEGSLEALSWLEKVYFDGKAKDGKAKASDANITVDPETGEKTFGFVVPPDILFDLNRGEEFAAGYKGAWAFRTTQGAGYGKAIAPYAEVTLGEGILVTKSKDAIKQKMEAELNQLFLTERGEIDANKAKKGTRAEALKLARKKQLNQLFIGGQRLQSTSDTRYDNASDYLLIALEMQTMHGGVQVYTKVPGAVHFFELCGMCTNMSLMPKGGGLEMVDGQLVPVDTATGGMNPDVAKQLREDNPHAGTITIGVNDRHIRAMMNQFFRDFIIPYHASGGNADLIARFRAIQEGKSPAGATMPKSTDYTKTQNDKILSDAILANDAMYRHSLGREATFEPEEIADIHDFRRARLYLLTKLSDDIKAGREAPAGLERMWTTVGIQENDPRYRSHLILQNLYRSLTEGKWQGVKLSKDIIEGQIFPNEFWDTSVNYENSSENTENYLAYCEALGFMHRFSGQGVAMKKVNRADGSYVVRNTNVPIKGTTYDGNETMLTDLAYQVTYDKNGEAHYVIDEEGKRVIEPYFWKVLTDRRMYDNDGNYMEQPYVSLEGLVGTGSEEDIARGVASVASKTEGIAHNMGERAYNRPRSLDTANVPVGERMRNRFFEEAKKLSETNPGENPMEIKRSKNVKRYALGMDDPGYETSKSGPAVTDDRGQVLYVEPTSDAWAVARDADGSLLNTDYLKNELGMDIFDNPRDTYEVEKRSSVIPAKSDQKHGTANPSTAPSYAQAFDYLQEKHGENAKNLHVLDASSGLGHGTKLGRDTLFKGNEKNIVELEPFPGNRQVDYRNYGGLIAAIEAGEEEPFDFIISNAVINVMAQDAREELLSSLLRMLKPGGQLYINPAFSKTWKIGNTPISLAEYEQMRSNGEDVSGKNVMLAPATDTTGQEVYVNGSHSVQKGYTPSEFKAFAEDVAKQALGEEITIQNGNSKDVPGINKGFIITRGEKTGALTDGRKDEVSKLITDIDKGTQHGPRYAMGKDETSSSNPYPPETIEHDLLAILERGDPEALGKWVTEQMDLNKQAEENSKIRPPVIPTKGFVPRITPQQKAALEAKRKGLIQKKGAMKPSEKNANGFQMPKFDENNNPFRRNIQNVGSAKQIPQDAVDQLENFAITDVAATYVPDSNKVMIEQAKREISQTGDLEKSKAQFQKMARDSYDHTVSAQDIAFGEQLLIETSRSGDTQGFLDTLASLVEISTTAGKTLQAFRMLKQSGPIGQLYYMEKVVDRLNNNLLKRGYNADITIDKDLAQAVLDAETDEDRDKALDVLKASIAKQMPVTFKDRIDAWRYLSMLGNFRTHIRNVVGNAIFVPIRFTKDIVAAGNEFLLTKAGLMGQQDRTKAVSVSREWKAFAKEQAEVWKKELQGNGKYNPAREILEARKVLPGFLDALSRINGEYLEKEDWAFLRPAFTRALAMALQNTGYSVEEIRTSNNKEVRQAYNRAIKIAIEEAQKATYRDYSAAAAALNRLKRLESDKASGRFFGVLLEGTLPFTKTPINILKRGIEYSPIGLATSIASTIDGAVKHNLDGAQIADSLASGLTGTAIMVLGWLLARSGVLRGKRKDEKEEQFEKLQGYQDYSIQWGDQSFTIDWAAPVALPLFTGASLAEVMDNSEDLEWSDAWDAMMMIAEPMMSLSMLSGLNDVLSSASYADDNQKLLTIGKSMLSSYLGQMFPTIGGQLARSIDGTRRQTYVDKNSKVPTALQRFVQASIQNKMPGWESQKAPYVDQWGRQSTVNSKVISGMENFFAPWYRSVVNTTDIDEQLQALYDSKDVSDENHKTILPVSPAKSFKVNGEDKYLTADEYVSFATDVGQTKYKMLTSLLSDARYLALTDDQKALAVKYIYDYSTAAGKYHIAPDFDIHRAGKWIEEAEAAKSDYERFEIIWKKIAAAIEK